MVITLFAACPLHEYKFPHRPSNQSHSLLSYKNWESSKRSPKLLKKFGSGITWGENKQYSLELQGKNLTEDQKEKICTIPFVCIFHVLSVSKRNRRNLKGGSKRQWCPKTYCICPSEAPTTDKMTSKQNVRVSEPFLLQSTQIGLEQVWWHRIEHWILCKNHTLVFSLSIIFTSSPLRSTTGS